MAVAFLRAVLPQDANGRHVKYSGSSEKLLEQGQASSKKELSEDQESNALTSPFKINPRIISDATIGLYVPPTRLGIILTQTALMG